MLTALLAALGLITIDLKPGQVFDHHQVTLFKDGVAGEPVNTTDNSVTFTDLEPGTYHCEGVSVDGAGEPMTSVVVSNSFVIEAPAPSPAPAPPPATAAVVNSITITLAPVEPVPALPAP